MNCWLRQSPPNLPLVQTLVPTLVPTLVQMRVSPLASAWRLPTPTHGSPSYKRAGELLIVGSTRPGCNRAFPARSLPMPLTAHAMTLSQPHLNASPMLAPPPTRRASDYYWWDMPEDIDDDWQPASALSDRAWLDAFGRTPSNRAMPPPQHRAVPRPSAQV